MALLVFYSFCHGLRSLFYELGSFVFVSSSFDVKGFVSRPIALSLGVRQGCPLSLLPYFLVAEVLACNFPSNPDISSLALPGSSLPLPCVSACVDDTCLIVSTSQSILEVFNVYFLFETGYGREVKPS